MVYSALLEWVLVGGGAARVECGMLAGCVALVVVPFCFFGVVQMCRE